MNLESLVGIAWLIPAFTALACVIIVAQIASGRAGRSSGLIAVGGIIASAVLGLIVFAAALGEGGHLSDHPAIREWAWLPMGNDTLNFGMLIDPLSAATVAMVTVVCSAIFIYATSYMAGEFKAYKDPQTGEMDAATGAARYARFFAYVSLFATGMLGFVLSSNLLQALVFWEIMGLCSFLLIGFWYYKPSAAEAAKKAFLTTRIGDLPFFVGIMLLYWHFQSVDFADMLSPEGIESLKAAEPLLFDLQLFSFSLPLGPLIALLIFGGTVGKSAQFPLHIWLPDAMEGPTPVSALIHAATMVSAGVFLVARMYPVFSAHSPESPTDIGGAMFVVAAIGAITALMAATIALAQFDIKRVLAYSTISQLGYMVAALGIGAYVAAVFHLLTHAFFKALLFLGSGSVIHGVEHGMHHAHDDDHDHDAPPKRPITLGPLDPAPLDPHDPQDMRNMGGLRERMPQTFWTYLIGTLALTGIPVFAGFWSKDEILAEAFHKGVEEQIAIALFVWVMLTAAAFMTAFYMARQIFMTFMGEPADEGAAHAHESDKAMTYPLIFLSLFAVVLGLVGVHKDFPVLGKALGENPFHDFMGYLTATGGGFATVPFNMLPVVLSIVIALAGWFFGWLIYGRNPGAVRAKDPLRRLGGLWRLLNQKYYVDELYNGTVVRGAVAFAGLNRVVDSQIVDGLVNAAGRGGKLLGDINGWIDTNVVDATVNLIAYVNGELAGAFKLLQSGRVQTYLLIVFTGLLLLAGGYIM